MAATCLGAALPTTIFDSTAEESSSYSSSGKDYDSYIEAAQAFAAQHSQPTSGNQVSGHGFNQGTSGASVGFSGLDQANSGSGNGISGYNQANFGYSFAGAAGLHGLGLDSGYSGHVETYGQGSHQQRQGDFGLNSVVSGLDSNHGQISGASGSDSYDQDDSFGQERHGEKGSHGSGTGSSGYDYGTSSSSGHDVAIPVHEDVEIHKPVAIPVYKHTLVKIPKPLHINVPHPVIVPVPQPYPIKVPVNKPVPVPVVKEITIPVEKVVPYPVVKHVPYPVEKHVPYKVEKTITVHVPKPYPVKIPVLKVIHHHKKGWH